MHVHEATDTVHYVVNPMAMLSFRCMSIWFAHNRIYKYFTSTFSLRFALSPQLSFADFLTSLITHLSHFQSKRDLITGLKTRTIAGRPNWDKVFKQVRQLILDQNNIPNMSSI